jgi:general secretion pathway protein J
MFMTADRGFTLLEFLVALTILALMLGVTMNSLNFSVRTSNSVETAILATEQVHLVHRALRQQIQTAMPVLRQTDSARKEVDFSGRADSLELIAPLRGLGTYSGPYRIRFEVQNDTGFGGNQGRLVMHYIRYSPDTAADWTEEGGSTVVLDGFASAALDYRPASSASGEDWIDEWRDTMRLPGLVRLRIEYPPGSQRVAPDLVVPIRSISQSRLLQRGGR